MKVMIAKELAAQLMTKPEALVILSRDAEGNEFSPLVQVQEGGWAKHSVYRGHVTDAGVGKPAFILWPAM